MVCTPFRTATSSGFVCGPRRRFKLCACGSGRRANLECDWKVPERESGTCDAAICVICSTSPAPDKDLCPSHTRAFIEWRTANQKKGDAP